VSKNQDRAENNFDGLRIVAACMVIVTHSYVLLGYPQHDWLHYLTNSTSSISRLGVWIFFIISGYLVTASAFSSKTVFHYLAKRALRIFPALVAVVILTILVIGPIASNISFAEYITNTDTWRYLRTITLYRMHFDIPGVLTTVPYANVINGSLWTLPYEWTLYLVPILVLFLHRILRRYARGSLLIMWLLSITAIPFFITHTTNLAVPFLIINAWHLINFGIFFLSGIVMYLYKDEIHFSKRAAVFSLILWCAVSFIDLGRPVAMFVIPYATLSFALAKPFLTPLTKFGDISYGLYIYAFPIQQLLVLYCGTMPIPLFIFLSGICTLPFAYLSWRYIEKPFLQFKKYLV
jgi:peptidoglycan/LPS O-acetylase OafA/YrhL